MVAYGLQEGETIQDAKERLIKEGAFTRVNDSSIVDKMLSDKARPSIELMPTRPKAQLLLAKGLIESLLRTNLEVYIGPGNQFYLSPPNETLKANYQGSPIPFMKLKLPGEH